MIALDGFTPTERRMLAVLLDYKQHNKVDIIACVSDGEGKSWTVHLANLRRKLRQSGYTVMTTRVDTVILYQLGRTYRSGNDGRS